MTLIALALGSLLAMSPGHDANAKEGFGSLSVDEVARLVEKGEADVFDNNGKDRFLQSHVPGAKWLPFNEVKESDLPRDKSRKLVFYCANSH